MDSDQRSNLQTPPCCSTLNLQQPNTIPAQPHPLFTANNNGPTPPPVPPRLPQQQLSGYLGGAAGNGMFGMSGMNPYAMGAPGFNYGGGFMPGYGNPMIGSAAGFSGTLLC